MVFVADHLSKGQKKRLERHHTVMQKIGLIPPTFVAKPKKEKHSTEVTLIKSEIENSGIKTKSKLEDDAVSSLSLETTDFNSNKSRKSIAIRETNRMRLIQRDPNFINDPIAAVTLHLMSMKQKNEGSKT